MKCIKCGAELKPSAKFCKYCGTQNHINISENSECQSMDLYDDVNTDGFIKCRNCGELVGSDNKFCIKCGAPLVEIQKVELNENKRNLSERKGRGLTTFITSTLIIAIILIVFVIIYILSESGVINSTKGGESDILTTQEEYTIENTSETSEVTSIEQTTVTANTKKRSFTGNVEDYVKQIRIVYNNITSGISNDRYQSKDLRDGIVAYYDGTLLKAIIIPSNVDGIKYRRFYYYDNDKLCFAYYENYDAHRFYFSNDEMIRWRYSADASNAQNAINYDLKDTLEYNNWETEILTDSYVFASSSELTAGSYILADSDSRYITKLELSGFSAEKCRLARNEIYARHGRMFDDTGLQNYFNSLDWYNPTILPNNFQESMLNAYEIANRDLIVEYEREQGFK